MSRSSLGRRPSLFAEDDDGEDPTENTTSTSQGGEWLSAAHRASILKDSSAKSDADAIYAKPVDRQRVAFAEDGRRDSQTVKEQQRSSPVRSRKANLTIRQEDEARIINGLQKAAKKQATGSIYSVIVDISKTGTLDIGVKDLPENLLAVSLLKRENDRPGAAEEAGVRLGDVIFGINFIPAREGSKTLITIIRLETEKKKRHLHIQAWRCHQLCSDPLPGYLFPRADDMFVRSYDLFRSRVFNEWERWNFIEMLVGYDCYFFSLMLMFSYQLFPISHMVEDLHLRSQHVDGVDFSELGFSSAGRVRARQMQALDLERNILQAKGLRSAINVRIVHTKSKEDTVTYILRVEDVESGLVWVATRRFNEFHALYEELNETTHFLKDIEFPKKRLSIRINAKVIENRIIMLEQFVRKSIHTLVLYASMDSTASDALRRIQQFLSVEKHVDCVHPPLVDDQRAVEIMAYRFLNDFNSPACQQCVRFTASVELDNMIDPGEEGYKGLLTFMHDALAEVEQFVQQQHEQQLLHMITGRRPEWSSDQRMKLVRQCIRRQVEAALFLPLRRSIFRLVQQNLAARSKHLQRAIAVLQQAKPSVFMIDINVPRTESFPRAIKAFRKALLAHLPADQGQFLIEAANSISDLHAECRELQNRKNRKRSVSVSVPSAKNIVDPADKAKLNAATVTDDESSSNGRQRSVSSNGRSKDVLLRRDSRGETVIDERTSVSSFSRQNSNNGSGGFERRPSLQARIHDFVLAGSSAKKKNTNKASNDDDEDEDEGNARESENSQRVSFAVVSNTPRTAALEEAMNGTSRSPPSSRKVGSYTPKRDMPTLDRLLGKTTSSSPNQQEERKEESAHPLFQLDGSAVFRDTSPVSKKASALTSSLLQPPSVQPVSVLPNNLTTPPRLTHPEDSLTQSSSTLPARDTPPRIEELSLKVSSPSSSSAKNSSRSSKALTQLNRLSSRHEEIIDPLLRPPTEEDPNHVDEALFAEVFDRYKSTYEDDDAEAQEDMMIQNAISADDFLPLFTYVVVSLLFLSFVSFHYFCLLHRFIQEFLTCYYLKN